MPQIRNLAIKLIWLVHLIRVEDPGFSGNGQKSSIVVIGKWMSTFVNVLWFSLAFINHLLTEKLVGGRVT